jgi:hypothetical protein
MINPLKPKLVLIIFKNSVRTAKKTQHFTITKINWLMLFKEMIIRAMMMEATRTSETSVNFYQTTRRYNPEDSRRLVSLKSYEGLLKIRQRL